jgi:hypothetical protein
MWADEINDPEYQDPNYGEVENRSTTSNNLPSYKDLYYQPITSLNKRILNAVTGEEYKYRIGSNDEKRFYVVMTQDPWEPKEACRLFFSSPQAYENFAGVKVSDASLMTYRKNQQHFREIDAR